MPKEIDESKLNYNKYPGEHVVALDETVHIGEKTFRLVQNVKEAFEAEKLEQRYTGYFDRFDYIVGDWADEKSMLRIAGFYANERKNSPAEMRIARLSEYLQEYVNYGSPYFILARERAEGEEDLPFEAEVEGEAELARAHDRKQRNERNRKRNNKERGHGIDRALSTKRPDGGEKQGNPKKRGKKEERRPEKRAEKRPEKKERPKRTDNRPKFTIRNRED
ncbi:MAG: YutD family protein [Streptococcaceae bacterium]|jgi:uncharacterized protein YutD|nr:YutD family protein [Streptococcaceae bacterium]